MQPAVLVQEVSKSFGALQAVDRVSFQVQRGEIHGLLGPNGAGKTTTIRMLLDIYQPDEGTISLFGGPIDEAKRRRIGYLPEERGLYQDQALETVLLYLAALKGFRGAQARQRLHQWLERFDLLDKRSTKVQELSRGMQQKAQLISTFLHDPDLVVLDEPFSGLDPVNTRLVKDLILQMAQQGKAILMSTHQMHQVESLCARITLIDRGQVVLSGEVAQIKRQFGGDVLEVAGSGTLPKLQGVSQVRAENGLWHLSLEAGVDPRAVLRQIVASPQMTITRIALAEPSLEDIFIAVVKGREDGHA